MLGTEKLAIPSRLVDESLLHSRKDHTGSSYESITNGRLKYIAAAMRHLAGCVRFEGRLWLGRNFRGRTLMGLMRLGWVVRA
jgi:hypothetical protein